MSANHSTDLARVAYEGYRNHTGGISLASGQPIPEWEALRQDIKDAWHAAAEAVLYATLTPSALAARGLKL